MAGRIGCADTKDLDRPVWTSLTQGLSNIAQGTSGALRILPDYGQFAASADLTPENLAALGRLTASGEIWLLERKPLPPVPGATVVSQGEYLQMILSDPMRPEEDRSVTMLGDADAEEMRRLAELTNPGPFYPRSHQL
ncbi:MAG TPA: GNAT family N-acetyltransferase, partial [Sphingobium sp.]|nr:GNAT family N-acetyltransferase [Sphingobium sp.]